MGSSEEKSEGLGSGGGICIIPGPGPGEFDWTMSDKSAVNQWNADICGIIWFSGIVPAPVRARAPGRILIGEILKGPAPATPRFFPEKVLDNQNHNFLSGCYFLENVRSHVSIKLF